LKLLSYEPERPVRGPPPLCERIAGFIDSIMTISLEDDEGNKSHFLFICEYKPTIPNSESLMRQIQYYEDLIRRESFVKEMDMQIVRVLLTLDPQDAWDRELRAKGIHVFRAMRSLDELFWDTTEPKAYEDPWRVMIRTLKDLERERIELKECLGFHIGILADLYLKMGLKLPEHYYKD
jgi:hypothetical protein